jgi:hypothetical protein
MSVEPTLEGEVVSQSLAVRPEAQALVPAQEMTDLLARGAQQATIIADLLRKQHLITRIGPREHIRFEGWVPIATANGKRLDTIEVHYEGTRGAADFTASACVGLRDIRTGEVVAKAWASCSRREKNWNSRDDYAIESMAQTRAGGKVCRMVYGWIISLAGFEATPSEEISESEAALQREITPKSAPAPREPAPEKTGYIETAERVEPKSNAVSAAELKERAARETAKPAATTSLAVLRGDVIRLYNRHPPPASAYIKSNGLPLAVADMTRDQVSELREYIESLSAVTA